MTYACIAGTLSSSLIPFNGLKLWLDDSDINTLTTSYQNLTSTVTGTSGLSALVCSSDESPNVFAPMTVRVNGTDIYTVQSVATSVGVTTITVVGTLSANYTTSALAVLKSSQENDKSGNGNNALQGTTTAQPIYSPSLMNNLPGLIYNGAASQNVAAATSIANLFGAGGTYIGVVKPTGNQGELFNKSRPQFIMLPLASGGHQLRFTQLFTGGATNGQWATTNRDLTQNIINIVALTYNSSSTANVPSIYVNSLTPKAISMILTPTGVAASDATDSLSIANAFIGFEGENLFYNTILNSIQLAAIFNFYSKKYGVILT